MARGIPATPTPTVLAWARDTAGLTLAVAAKRAHVSEERLASWERGDANPTVSQLRLLAAAYKRPLALFYLPEPPRAFTAMHDYRRLPDADTQGKSPELLLEIRKAWNRRDVALELCEGLDEPIPTLPDLALPQNDPERAGELLRGALGVTVEDQARWSNENDAFKNWRAAVERLGILVFQALDVPIEEARGFSMALFPLPVIAVNIKDTPRGRCFTLLHELAHVFLRQSSICDFHEAAQTPADAQTEAFCNHVAAAVLLPRDAFLADPLVRPHMGPWQDETLIALVRRFAGASQEAIIRRLVILGRATPEFYEHKRAELLDIYRQRRANQAQSGGFAPHHQLALTSAGRPYTALVMEGYHRDRITASDVADYLDVRLKHLPEIESDLRRRAG